MVGCWRVVDVLPAYSEQRAFQWLQIHTITETFFFVLWDNKTCMNNGETCSPHILKHCGAITGALNIPAQHDAARRPLDCALPLRGSFHTVPLISLKSTQVQATGRRRPHNGFLNSRELHLRHSVAA